MTLLAAAGAHGDELLYRYEGDYVPGPDQGWIRQCCPIGATDRVQDGNLVVVWTERPGFLGYHHWIAQPPEIPPPPPFWLEWRFRSDQPWDRLQRFCDAAMQVQYMRVFNSLLMFGDTVISLSGDDAVSGLPNNQFRTYRFETTNGLDYCYWIDGQLFTQDAGTSQDMGYSSFQLQGDGPCGGINYPFFPKINEWDYVRYGRVTTGEEIIAAEPEQGFHDPDSMTGVDRFAVTFDQPNYVYVDDITVEVTGGEAPQILWTRRRDQDGPESLEIVLDRPLPPNETTRFIMSDGGTTNIVRYTLQWADTNGDGAVDLRDAAALQNCFGINKPTSAVHQDALFIRGWNEQSRLPVQDQDDIGGHSPPYNARKILFSGPLWVNMTDSRSLWEDFSCADWPLVPSLP